MLNNHLRFFKYNFDIEALIEAKAQEQHAENLSIGGSYSDVRNKFSDIDQERLHAKGRVCFAGPGVAALVGIPSTACRYIKGFGYVGQDSKIKQGSKN